MDLVLLFGGIEIAFLLFYCLPLGHSIFTSVNKLQPGFWLFLGASITSSLPLYEGFSTLLQYKPRAGEQVLYENDPRYLNAIILALKASGNYILWGCFLLVQYLATQKANLKLKLEKAELNRMATQKQAEAASKQTLAMLDELEKLKDRKATKGLEISGSIDDIKKKLRDTENKLEEADMKAKIIQENYVKLIEEYSQLEKAKTVAAPGIKKESKKDK